MSFSSPALERSVRLPAQNAVSPTCDSLRLRVWLLALLWAVVASVAVPVASAQSATTAAPWDVTMCNLPSPVGAQPFPDSDWNPYRDHFCMIHSKKPDNFDPNRDNNALLYTAEACVIMQLQNVSYKKSSIADGLPHWQIEGSPGLYRHAPDNMKDTEGPDDYIGLGALAGICGFHSVAREILTYGQRLIPPSAFNAAELNPADKRWPALLRRRLDPTGPIPYNYNNLNPGVFTPATWMGRSPGLIIHLKIGAGDKPSRREFAIWSAALLFSGESGLEDPPHSNQSAWLQSWLMVLTYEMSHFHSYVADRAVDQWWQLLYQRYPDGLKQAMTQYLNDGRDGTQLSKENPLSDHIEDFKGHMDRTAERVYSNDNDTKLVNALKGLFSMDCGQGVSTGPCIIDNDFSQATFLAAFSSTLSAAKAAVGSAQLAVGAQQHLCELQEPVLNKVRAVSAGADDDLAHLNSQKSKISKSISDKAAQIGKLPDLVPDKPECHWKWGVYVCKPRSKPSPDKQLLVKELAALNRDLLGVQNSLGPAADKANKERTNLATETTTLKSLKSELDRSKSVLSDAEKCRGVAKDGLEGAQAAVEDIIPGVVLTSDK